MTKDEQIEELLRRVNSLEADAGLPTLPAIREFKIREAARTAYRGDMKLTYEWNRRRLKEYEEERKRLQKDTEKAV